MENLGISIPVIILKFSNKMLHFLHGIIWFIKVTGKIYFSNCKRETLFPYGKLQTDTSRLTLQ